METNNKANPWRRRIAWIALLVIALTSLVIVILPAWIIQPFKPQSQRGLEISFALRSWSPLATVLALAFGLVLVAWLWRASHRWWRKAFLIVILMPLFVSTWFARQNHFEWMFNPLPNPAYAKASDAAFVADDDIVMSVENNGETAAYPVRLMAYHHVVQDVVGGTPIVATY
jgi:MFS family permease